MASDEDEPCRLVGQPGELWEFPVFGTARFQNDGSATARITER
jgi:hypothetical protein